MGTPWDARAYDLTSAPQQSWAEDVIARLLPLAPGSRVLDVGCGTGLVTERLLELAPGVRVIAVDASPEMTALARERLAGRAEVLCQDALALDVGEPVDAIVSTAALHWVPSHELLWRRLAAALRPGGVIEAQCGGAGNIARVREAIDSAARELAPELLGWSPWEFATPERTRERMLDAGFHTARCWLQEKPTEPGDPDAFVRTSILAAHLERLPAERREPFAAAVCERVRLPLDYVRLNISGVRG
ncbi:MAG TPA: methyltransferase domain-containing protein [Solirubrobacteraceae bacterium]|nr:methyltransferase domain-containing protein [Solirubrobacteraceae bacterium]